MKNAGVSVLRWPGGGWLEWFDWKKAIGPASARPHQKFGLDEYLTFCERVGAIPLIMIPSDRYDPAYFADFVEYLNTPNDHSNPNGGVDWAAVRAKNGRDKPWGVKWFEFGNESYTKMSPDEYVDRYKAVYKAVMNVDPGIRLGAVLEDTTNFEHGWSSTILSKLGKEMSFAIIHPYLPKVNAASAAQNDKNEIALATVSTDADLIYRLEGYNKLIVQMTGRARFADSGIRNQRSVRPG